MRHVRKDRELLWLVLDLLLLCVQEIELLEQPVYCPSQCVCTKVRSRPAVKFKFKCGGGDKKISNIEELNLQNVRVDLFHLWVFNPVEQLNCDDHVYSSLNLTCILLLDPTVIPTYLLCMTSYRIWVLIKVASLFCLTNVAGVLKMC